MMYKTLKVLPVSAEIEELGSVAPMSDEEIQQRTQSLIENISAFRFALARIDILEGLVREARRALVDVSADAALVRKIDTALSGARL